MELNFINYVGIYIKRLLEGIDSLKILICISQLSAGGAERVVCNLANYLSLKNDVKVISLTQSDIAYSFSEKVDIEFIDQKKYLQKEGKIMKLYHKLSKNVMRIFRLKKQINLYNPTVILSFLPEPSFFTLFLKRKKTPVIISVRNDPKVEYKNKIYYFLMKWLYPKSDGIVFQTEEASNYFKSFIKCKTTIIPNPINPSFISLPYNGVRKKNIVSVGRLSSQKNHKLLLRAFSNLPKKFSDYKLIIFGEGALRKDLLSEIEKLGLNNKVFLPGVKKNIKNEVYDASLFVLSSDYEGMPNALMEAMALGLPVISTNCPCGGPAFLIKNNINGVLIDVNNANQLTKAMAKILSDSAFSKKISYNASKISKTLNPSIINKKWENFIKSVVKDSDSI